MGIQHLIRARGGARRLHQPASSPAREAIAMEFAGSLFASTVAHVAQFNRWLSQVHPRTAGHIEGAAMTLAAVLFGMGVGAFLDKVI
jgi:hypothetical protein